MAEPLTPDSKEVLEFIRCGREFCDLYDCVPAGEDLAWTKAMRLAVVDLYRAACVLSAAPMVEIGSKNDDVDEDPPEDVVVYESRLGAPFGEKNYYAEAFNPYALNDPKNLVCGSLADDLYDIHRDVSAGIRSWADADRDEQLSLIWHWRFGFSMHWWEHATGAIRALHAFISEKDDGFGE